MAEIKVLPPEIANLIAAGEVVERPASVVKELLENAMDAGATAITVAIRRGGLGELRVTDNGWGIPALQLKTAFLRHATSKMTQAEQLATIATLGFRGEALAAIAAVSRIQVTSGVKGELFAQFLSLEGGEIQEEDQVGAPTGTTIVVKDLFFNTPARLKFMKAERSEGAAVFALVQQLALSHPEISFKFLREGKEELNTLGDGKLPSVAFTVLGKEVSQGLTPVSWEEGGMSLSGLACLPSCCRGSRSFQHFFVNGRYIKSKLLAQALEDAYQNQKMVGKFPVALLYIQLPLGQVDVNVHPAKTVVKFAQERAVFDLIFQGVSQSLAKRRDIQSVVLPEEPTGNSPENSPQTEEKQRISFHSPTFREELSPEQRPPSMGADGFWIETPKGKSKDGEKKLGTLPTVSSFFGTPSQTRAEGVPSFKTEGNILESKNNPPNIKENTPQTVEISNEITRTPPHRETKWGKSWETEEKPSVHTEPNTEAEVDQEELPEDFILLPKMEEKPQKPEEEEMEQEELPMEQRPWRVVGEFFHAYIAVEQGDQVLFLDKHAIHERVNFNRLKDQNYKPMAQLLIVPIVLHFSPKEHEILLEHQDLLQEFAFEVEEFSVDALVVRQGPFDIPQEKIGETLLELAEKLLTGAAVHSQTARDHLLHTMACKAAIKAGWHTQEEEYAKVVKMVMEEGVQHCPHGRPVVVSLSQNELEKRFKRC